jgi:hypothetical protein
MLLVSSSAIVWAGSPAIRELPSGGNVAARSEAPNRSYRSLGLGAEQGGARTRSFSLTP